MIEALQLYAAQYTRCYYACQIENEMEMSICEMNNLECA